MNDIAIRVESLSKQYRIGENTEKYKTLRDSITDAIAAPLRRMRHFRAPTDKRSAPENNIIWALKDVSFEITRGEVVGIIGRNGAGKSTLLKILSRITEPTSGYGEIHGRVGSLLEVGTGFHGELSGRENIYLSSAILGMKRSEIDRKFDEIVAFAEVEKFVDTPVKHYSSGMYLRLAFAVAAYLEPEILLVDEVLAVGDARFQKKCLSKMKDIGQYGRTVLFVSHNMPALTNLCPRAILLDGGKTVMDGPSVQVVNSYLTSGLGTTGAREWPDPARAPGGEMARLRAVRVRTEDGRVTDTVDIRQPFGVEMEYDVLESGKVLLPNIHFFNGEGVYAFGAQDLDPDWRQRPRPAGRYASTVWLPGNLLADGTIVVNVALNTMDPIIVQFHETNAVAFQVVDSFEGDAARGDWPGKFRGVVRPMLKWTTQVIP
jgi:lipopolysaccharide transport system ATP-binding protein